MRTGGVDTASAPGISPTSRRYFAFLLIPALQNTGASEIRVRIFVRISGRDQLLDSHGGRYPVDDDGVERQSDQPAGSAGTIWNWRDLQFLRAVRR
jgi:hypothetical protein